MLDSVFYDILLCFVVILILIYLFVKDRYGYFKKRQIPYNEPVFLLGNTWRNLLGRENLVDSCARLYDDNPSQKYIGVFQGLVPLFFVRDPRLVEEIMIKDFSRFHDRGIPFDEVANPLEGHLFNLTGSKWKTLRNELVPAFTSGKLKGMLNTMQESINSFVDEFENMLGKEIEMKSLFTRLNLHIIGTCAFGIDIDTIKNPNSKFPQFCKKIAARDGLTFIKGVIRFIFPSVAKFFGFRIIPKETNDFFMDLVKEGFQHRLKNSIKRNDFLQLLLELREKGEILKDEREYDDGTYVQDKVEDNGKLALTDETLTAQAFVFFLGGYETTSTALSFLFYTLSKHQDKQDKLRDEVLRIKAKYGGFTYEALKAMVYGEACINESMRLYPPVGVLARKCNRTLSLPDGLKLEKGNLVFVPVYSIQRDAAYFPDPLSFTPERFINSKPATCTYLPFGDGPRMCIAQRFALLLMKATLAEMISRFRVDTCEKMSSLEPIKLLPRAFVTTPKDGIHCILTRLPDVASP